MGLLEQSQTVIKITLCVSHTRHGDSRVYRGLLHQRPGSVFECKVCVFAVHPLFYVVVKNLSYREKAKTK